jgi:RNA polymerase sigma-70 factor (ECF subfamily)
MSADLIVRAQRGDHDAYASLVRAAVPRLQRTARLILRDEDDAADAVQDALTTAWLDIRSVRVPGSFDGWLYRLLVRACYRTAGRARRQGALQVAAAALPQDVQGDSSTTVALRDQLDRGLRRLPADQRAVLVVHHYLQLRDEEAARVLGIPAGTFKSRLSRATGALRAVLEADERAFDDAREALA